MMAIMFGLLTAAWVLYRSKKTEPLRKVCFPKLVHLTCASTLLFKLYMSRVANEQLKSLRLGSVQLADCTQLFFVFAAVVLLVMSNPMRRLAVNACAHQKP